MVQPALDNIDDRFDGLETLDGLSCTATQVVINDGGWRCADPILTRSFAGAFNYTLETTGNVGMYSSVAVGADGNPIISHYDATNADLELYVCDNPTCTSGTNQTLETTGNVGEYTSVAIGADGNPIISHHDATNDDLELYVCTDPTAPPAPTKNSKPPATSASTRRLRSAQTATRSSATTTTPTTIWS